ncbi:MAG: ABC transporter permease [Saprospirales bacterium]|nr:MAG: ABC transporter permease [Saprospirales bacterium]
MIDAIKTKNLRKADFSVFSPKSIPLWIRLVLFVWIFAAVFADQLANELPLSCKIDGKRHYPAIAESIAKIRGDASVRLKYRGNIDRMESIVMAPIPYSPQTIDRNNTGFVSPFEDQHINDWKQRHWLGTDRLGRDIMAGMIHGARVAFVVGMLAVFFAFIIGVPLGAAAGYYGDRGIFVRGLVLLLKTLLLLTWLYLLYLQLMGAAISGLLVWLPFLLVVFLPFLIRKSRLSLLINRLPGFLSRTFSIPLDLILLRLIEVFRSLPNLFILLALLAVFGQTGMTTIALILALLMWPTFARYTRAEFLSLREKEFVSAARLFRKSEFRIIFTDILPNAKAPLIVISAFGISAAILAESTLSFLGLGLGIDQVSWGSMLSEARRYFPAWWMAVFPGFAIFIIIYALNSLGDRLR